MEYLKIKKIFEETIIDRDVVVKGWIRSVRNSKKFSFISLNDGSCQKSLQIIIDEVIPGYAEAAALLGGSSVEIEGTLVKSGGKGQSVEMQGKVVRVLGKADETYPIQKKELTYEYLREVSHFRARTDTFAAVFRIRHALSMATHQFFSSRGLYYIQTPIITTSDCEGAGEMFKVSTLDFEKVPLTADKKECDYSKDYFGEKAGLTVSGQLNAETLACALGGVYTFGPTFRSENSHTSRHLSEFWMVEPEVAFADLEDVAKLASDYVRFMIDYAFKNCEDELNFLESRHEEKHLDTLRHVRDSEFKMLTYTEAVSILEKCGKKFEFPVGWGHELQSEHERYLAEEHFKGPVIVTDYPKDFKAFYMKQNDDGKTVRCMDVLVPGIGEIIGGSQREENFEKLDRRIKEMKMDEKHLWWYLELRKFGTVPHSGFGLGFERAMMYITGMKNIRDVIPFARFPGSAKF